jgi:Phytanoyl-CoA dioxygenase (PhyH)
LFQQQKEEDMEVKTIDYRTTTPSAVIRALEEEGAVVLKDALSSDQLSRLDVETSSLLNRTQTSDGPFHGFSTKRVGGMIGKSSVCQTMALDPTVMSVMDHFLLPHCDRYQVNCAHLISIGPGEKRQPLHADDPLFPFDKKSEVMVNTMWMVDDFTEENGATNIVPGSHLWPRDRNADDSEVVSGAGSKGSCLIWLGSLRHAGGANKTANQWRRGIVIGYCLGWLRQIENQYLSIPLETAKTFPEPLQRLIGYASHRPNMGLVNGLDPIYLLADKQPEQLPGFGDHMPDHIQGLLDDYYQLGKKVMVA